MLIVVNQVICISVGIHCSYRSPVELITVSLFLIDSVRILIIQTPVELDIIRHNDYFLS